MPNVYKKRMNFQFKAKFREINEITFRESFFDKV